MRRVKSRLRRSWSLSMSFGIIKKYGVGLKGSARIFLSENIEERNTVDEEAFLFKLI